MAVRLGLALHAGGAFGPALSRWQVRRAALFAALDAIIRQGIDEGAFVDEPPEFVREVIFGMVQRTLFVYGATGTSHPRTSVITWDGSSSARY